MTTAEHEARIDSAERAMLQADNRTDRATFAAAFIQAITERNAERTPEEVSRIEQERGLRV